VQTFGWRLLTKAMPKGAREGKYSKHISKLCCRCGSEETDIHLFFLCPYARAAWFANPRYIKIDQMLQLNSSISQIILDLLHMHRPYGSIQNIITFLWCIWKARNDSLFNRKEMQPTQVIHMANAINQNLEMVNVVHDSLDKSFTTTDNKHKEHGDIQGLEGIAQGQTLKSDLIVIGNKIFTYADWKTRK
jgi:hypothetical protein